MRARAGRNKTGVSNIEQILRGKILDTMVGNLYMRSLHPQSKVILCIDETTKSCSTALMPRSRLK